MCCQARFCVSLTLSKIMNSYPFHFTIRATRVGTLRQFANDWVRAIKIRRQDAILSDNMRMQRIMLRAIQAGDERAPFWWREILKDYQ